MFFPKNRNQLYFQKSAEKSSYEFFQWKFILSSVIDVFSILLVSHVAENAKIWQLNFSSYILFCDPHIDELPKNAIDVEFPRSCNSHLPKNLKFFCFI